MRGRAHPGFKNPGLKRRKLLKTIGSAVAAAPFLSLAGCSGCADVSESGSSKWASGGTASLKVDIPPAGDPFDKGLGKLCSVTKSYTLGPCYFSPDVYRQDISEGEAGVPMVLVLKLVDANCQPIAGADIDIWHCDRRGIYSGRSAGSSNASRFNAPFCTGNNREAIESRWFRGVQATDDKGLAWFLTCFPGWYPGRTTHIHFKVVHKGVQSLVSQFCFDDALCNEVYLNHAEYTGQEKDTSNAGDFVFGSDYADYEIVVERQVDNSMLGYKAIQLV